jgi:hypothetical protein
MICVFATEENLSERLLEARVPLKNILKLAVDMGAKFTDPKLIPLAAYDTAVLKYVLGKVKGGEEKSSKCTDVLCAMVNFPKDRVRATVALLAPHVTDWNVPIALAMRLGEEWVMAQFIEFRPELKSDSCDLNLHFAISDGASPSTVQFLIQLGAETQMDAPKFAEEVLVEGKDSGYKGAIYCILARAGYVFLDERNHPTRQEMQDFEPRPFSHCANCAKEGETQLWGCCGCHLVAYCGVECQALHRPQHKEICKRAGEKRIEWAE